MSYNQQRLNEYRTLPSTGPTDRHAQNESSSAAPPYTPSAFRSRTCPYCNGLKDPTVKHVNPHTKPDSPWAFWRHVVIDKFRATQSERARENMARCVSSSSPSSSSAAVASGPDPSESTTHGTEAVPSSETLPPTSNADKMFVVGPMVDQSELPFRLLCREYGATLTYTPMLHAKLFRDGAAYRRHYLTTTPCDAVRAALNAAASSDVIKTAGDTAPSPSLSTPPLIDRPVFVQFCGNDAEIVLDAARLALYEEEEAEEDVKGAGHETDKHATPLYRCDAVDLNLGCPQGIAKRGHYGSFLMEDWETIHTIIHTLHVELEVPVTAKIRVFDLPPADGAASTAPQGGKNEVDFANVRYDEALSIEYARMVRDAGAQVICIHGRTRAMKGQQSGLANMGLIARIRDALQGSVPVIANGNVLTFDDVVDHLRTTRCEGHMCAEPLLWEPRVFTPTAHPVRNGRLFGADKAARLAAIQTAMDYLGWVRRCPVDLGFVKTHLFKMCHHSYELHAGFRDLMGQWGTATRNEAAVVAAGPAGEGDAIDEKEEEASDRVRRDTASETDANPSAGQAPVDVEAQLCALEFHLQALREAELRCDVDGEQPKTAHAEKQKAREAIKDVLDEDGDDVGFGLLF